jgi:hypothetical protein
MEASMSDLVERLRAEAMVCERSGPSSVAALLRETADEIERLREALHSAKAFIEAVVENDPDEPIADNGMTVWDGLQASAPSVIARIQAALKGNQ